MSQKQQRIYLAAFVLLGAFIFFLWIYTEKNADSVDNDSDSAAPPPTANSAPGHAPLKREMMVSLVKGEGQKYPACASQPLLFELAGHLERGEKDKSAALLDGTRCKTLTEGPVYRVLTVDGNFVELAPQDSRNGVALWTIARAVRAGE